MTLFSKLRSAGQYLSSAFQKGSTLIRSLFTSTETSTLETISPVSELYGTPTSEEFQHDSLILEDEMNRADTVRNMPDSQLIPTRLYTSVAHSALNQYSSLVHATVFNKVTGQSEDRYFHVGYNSNKNKSEIYALATEQLEKTSWDVEVQAIDYVEGFEYET